MQFFCVFFLKNSQSAVYVIYIYIYIMLCGVFMYNKNHEKRARCNLDGGRVSCRDAACLVCTTLDYLRILIVSARATPS